jgi:serine/threonine protein kinase
MKKRLVRHLLSGAKLNRPKNSFFFTESTEIDATVVIKHGGSFNERFEVLEELGKGRFGVVRKVIERDSGIVLAAKIIKCRKAADKEKVSHRKIFKIANYR